uniref:Phosphoglycerate mutase-like protein n=1 Tax=Dunaliella tertiolecta TaxID=3047 RepID=A0A7S3R9Z3_DUNTE|mmetsp:Transcript_18516/g.51979  ORF Transcript_18516/g.51979 Transcript_18516/m.51979 type:complete len:337 (+) Transcript_18516:85-1095(+)|eukprot:CAMPEP_0202347586 /NCGR_PEP_ID=MMETSP1126-20121109/5881_1 /ASSEMBLY_ACC=CAM_ASM_000457 /TAXON_ID=3047 /ORGANISM="Dunaliella tertiolecta, Strain CCMP1320" /LENGTH=336 /DNA_ID=CAMNT_0048939151 /DNA_START=63 /DNA_END=1073 /DNA_ORIENTATION=+
MYLLGFVAVCLASSLGVDASRPAPDASRIQADIVEERVGKHKSHWTSPLGYFVQERASKQLPGPGQHFKFGALKPWEEIRELVQNDPDSKLLLLIRHGQALSNALQEKLGPDAWTETESKCNYTDTNGDVYNLFDAELTNMGVEQAQYLNSILDGGGWFKTMSGGAKARAIVSPLSRCLNTALLVTKGLGIKEFSIEEIVRETLGEDTCDARRSVSDPNPELFGPCFFKEGLKTRFPMFDFPIINSQRESEGEGLGGLGMVSDEDVLWTPTREKQKKQVKRASTFLADLFESVPENIVPVITHSGFIRSLLLAVEREPYRPQNTELVPVIVTRKHK